MNVAILSSSPQKSSSSLRVAKAIAQLVKKLSSHHPEIIDFAEYDIPLIASGGITLDNLSSFQERLLKVMREAQLIIVVAPEYNWALPSELTNLINQVAAPPNLDLFDEKVFACVGVSTGKGGRQPAIQLTYILNKVIGFFNLQSMVSGKIFESHFTKEALNEQGLSNGVEPYDKGLHSFTEYTIQVAERWGTQTK